MKPESTNNTPSTIVAPALQITLPSQIPDCFKPFAGDTPSDIIKKVISFFVADDADAIQALTGLLSGMTGLNFDVPDWVKCASRKAMETNGMEFCLELKPDANPASVLEMLGKVTRVLEFVTNNPLPEGAALPVLASPNANRIQHQRRAS